MFPYYALSSSGVINFISLHLSLVSSKYIPLLPGLISLAFLLAACCASAV
jgi:hypothetical protein